MDNEVLAQAFTLTLIGVGTAFVLLIVLMLSIKIMSYILVKFISGPITKANEIDSSLDVDKNRDKVIAASLGVAAYRALLSKEKSD
jgi:Na+-transporting methylmalonyl-CoA/oxaloacetate decarboxylase gamma subunit|tara:strand:- start:180 stop:437 length:258 start_codon:yes stop_codon:yes gene_type:complete